MKIAQSIKKYGISRVARASGYPISTIFRWYRHDRVLGTGKAKELKERELAAAFAALAAVGGQNARR